MNRTVKTVLAFVFLVAIHVQSANVTGEYCTEKNRASFLVFAKKIEIFLKLGIYSATSLLCNSAGQINPKSEVKMAKEQKTVWQNIELALRTMGISTLKGGSYGKIR
jgi:hypothetical protein